MKKSNDPDFVNNDDFEKQLERRPVRPVPGEWRSDILAAAKASRPVPVKIQRAKPENNWLNILLWPSPKAWAGLAAAWVVLFLVNSTDNGNSTQMAQTVPPPTPEMIQVLNEQRRILAQLVEPLDPPPAEPPKPFIPRPRGELRLEVVVV